MGVYIKDMELPKDCDICRHPTCDLWIGIDVGNRHPKCPVVEVPEPHGRTIDADALVEDLKRQCEEVFKIDAVSPDDFWITRDQAYNEKLWETWCESFYKYLESRPTIIPASEEGET